MCGNFLRQSYLTNRSQAIVVGEYKSHLVTNHSGVPLGSHLGPLLFIMLTYTTSFFATCGNLLRWIESYLINRQQTVVVGGYKFDLVTIHPGVPQGSLLGPLFYNACLYDVYQVTNSQFLMYADDTNINVTNSDDCDKLQVDFNSLSN